MDKGAGSQTVGSQGVPGAGPKGWEGRIPRLGEPGAGCRLGSARSDCASGCSPWLSRARGQGDQCRGHPGRSVFGFELKRGRKEAGKRTDLRTTKKGAGRPWGFFYSRTVNGRSHTSIILPSPNAIY